MVSLRNKFISKESLMECFVVFFFVRGTYAEVGENEEMHVICLECFSPVV